MKRPATGATRRSIGRWLAWGAAALSLLVGIAPARANTPPFQPGEELLFRASYLNFDAGKITVQVERDRSDGRAVWPIDVHAKTQGLAWLMYRIRQHFVSEFEPRHDRSIGTLLESRVGKENRVERVRYQGAKALVQETKDGRTVESAHPMLPGAQDLLAAFFELRGRPLAVGSRFSVPVWCGRKSWRLTGTVVGRQQLKTQAGTFQTKVVRLRTHFGGKFDAHRDLTLWISDDDRRLPVQIAADFFVGTMKLDLVSYRPGGLTAEQER